MSARRRCVFCQETTESYVCFTENALLKAEWVSILSGGDATEMEKLRSRLTTRSFICRTHFPEESLTVTSSAVRVRPYAKPYPKGSPSEAVIVEAVPSTPTATATPTSGRRTLSKQNLSVKALRFDPVQPRRREDEFYGDTTVTRAEYISNRREERRDKDWDTATVQRTGTVTLTDTRKYGVVDIKCLAEIFLRCEKGCGETCDVKVTQEGPNTNVRAVCKDCSTIRKWASSPLVYTKAAGTYEKVHELNLDICYRPSINWSYNIILQRTSSQRLECIGLKRCLNEIKGFYSSYPDPISQLTTDRHQEGIKMMRNENPTIKHRFDAWHFCRNVLLALLKIAVAKCRKSISPWIPFINNHIWWSITSSTSGQEIREKYLSLLYHIRGVHAWPEDTSFKIYKGCTSHTAHISQKCCLDRTSKAFIALEKLIRTPSYLDAISSVSGDLGTAQIEGFNHIATIHEPKDRYFELEGHDLRTKISIVRHNEAQFDAIAGLRDPSIKRRYYDKTFKTYKERLIRPSPVHRWRQELTTEMYRIRRDLDSASDNQWNKASNPATPSTPTSSMAAFTFDDEENPDEMHNDEMDEDPESQRAITTFTDRLLINSMMELDYSDESGDSDSDD